MGKSVLIIGGGAFGISAAWHLSRELGANSKYSSIHVLDRFPPPSKVAAATDLNKIIRTEYSDPIYTELALTALEAWTDPNGIFQKHFHRSGWLLSASGGGISFVEQSERNAVVKGVDGVKFMTPAEVQSTWPVLNGAMEGCRILSSPAAGWATSGKILLEMAMQSADRGVSFISGGAGHVQRILFDGNGSCIGAQTVDGTTYLADSIVLAAGADTASLIDMEAQQCAMGHTVCCIQLLPEEIERYRDMVLVADIEEGCIFPPDENGIIKIASIHFVTNFGNSRVPGVSLPRFREDNPGDDIPEGIQQRLRCWISKVIPDLAYRPWSETRLCWDTETPTDDFIITNHPRHKGLFVTTGGSGHAFKFLPTLGIYISQLLDGTLPKKLEAKWRWGSSIALSGESSNNKSMFPKAVQELSQLPGWRSESAPLAKL